MKTLALVALVALAAGCSHNEPTPWPATSTPAPTPGCAVTIESTTQKPEVQVAMTKACVDDKWSADALRCYGDATTNAEITECDRELSPAQAANLSAAIASTGNGPLPPECQDYKAKLDRLAGCSQMPQMTQDAMKEAYGQMRAGWDQPAALPVDARAAMAAGCKAGADALQRGGVQLCGW